MRRAGGPAARSSTAQADAQVHQGVAGAVQTAAAAHRTAAQAADAYAASLKGLAPSEGTKDMTGFGSMKRTPSPPRPRSTNGGDSAPTGRPYWAMFQVKGVE